MNKATKSNAMPLVLGALAAIVLVVGIVIFVPQAPVPQTSGGAVVDSGAADTGIAANTPALPVPQAPRFDTFRVEADGSMVVAGRAEPGQVVAIVLAGDVIDTVTADASGSFVVFPTASPSPDPRSLTLVGDPDGAALRSDTSYIVAPIAQPQVVIAQVAPPAPDTAPAPLDRPDAPAMVAEPSPTAPAPQTLPNLGTPSATLPQVPVAPTVLKADGDGVRVVQSGPDLLSPNVALDAITYDPQGEVQLSGRAVGDGSVQVYLDNQPVNASPVTQGGDWRIDLLDVATGVYTLRVDEVNTDGAVVSRIETPFKREEPRDVAAVLAEETSQDGFDVAVRTVQPGATLWAIAEETLGNGIYYVQVYEANADLIRDPDLIYPGQIFRMPDVNQ